MRLGGPVLSEYSDPESWITALRGYGYRAAFCPIKSDADEGAVEAFADGLAEEMERFDVQVSVIEPGNYISNITNTALNRMADKGYANSESPYAKDFEEFLKWNANHTNRDRYKEPDEVAEAAVHALFGDDPKRRYMVVPSAEEAGWTIDKAVEELVQLNEWQAYSYSREELIAILDKAMAGEN